MTRKNTVLGVIPARFKSTRFEGKPLIEINGIPMIKRTYQQAKKSHVLDYLIVATEDQRIVDYCDLECIPVIMTSADCLTGTDRLAEVANKLHYDFYINIQGDEPVIDPKAISLLVDEYNKYGEEYIAYNLYKKIDNAAEISSQTIIKVIVNEQDELMYMSRLPIPFSNSGSVSIYKQQIPVYGFTAKALTIFSKREKTCNEIFEDIELLRFVDLGYKLKMLETTVNSIAVDVPTDVRKVEQFLAENNMT